MSESTDPVVLQPATAGPAPTAPSPSMLQPDQRWTVGLWLETGIVLLVGVVPELVRSAWALYWMSRSYESYSSAMDYSSADDSVIRAYPNFDLIARSVQVSAVALYVIWRSGDRWSLFGLMRPSWLKDPLLGFVVFVLGYAVYGAVYYAYAVVYSVAYGDWAAFMSLSDWELSDPISASLSKMFPAPRGVGSFVLLVLASCANGFGEELVMRGYLIPRFERLLRSTWLSLILTTVLFASYHAYQGLVGIMGAAVLGLVYGAAFCWLRRLWPVVIAHAVSDVVGSMWYGG